jgi:F-type H+-transporting ATPase subunit b
MDKLLNPDTGLLIWTIVTFLALVLILKVGAWGPLVHAIEEREARLKAERDAAENARAAAEKLQKEIEAQMADLGAKTRELLNQAQKDSDALRSKLKGEAESDSEKIRAKTMQELADEKERLVRELRKEIATLSVTAAERLLRKSVDEGVQKSVLEGFYKDLEARKVHG